MSGLKEPWIALVLPLRCSDLGESLTKPIACESGVEVPLDSSSRKAAAGRISFMNGPTPVAGLQGVAWQAFCQDWFL